MLHSIKLRILVACSFLACTVPLAAQLDDSDAVAQNKCKHYLAMPLPPEAAQVPQPKAWPDCNSYRLYSGIGTEVNYAAARRCAWSERLAQQADLEPRYTVASVIGGSAMLTVLYTNGEGVQRDLSLALRFACEAEGAPAEISIRINDIESRFAKPDSAKGKFDFCSDITSGFMEGFCAAYSSEFADEKRIATLHALSVHMSPAQRQAFDQMNKQQQAYARAHASGEIDTSGTARAMYEIDAEDSLRDDFLAALQSFEAGKLPMGSAEDYRDADARLNSAYRKQMDDAEENKNEYGAVQPKGIRSAERAWLKYRDGWIAFAKLRYPGVSAEAWLLLLTNDRISVLNDSFCDMDDVEGPCAWKGDTWKPSPLP